jgi:hypothetical protein
MMTQREIKEWRAKERERLNALHLTIPKKMCMITIEVLSAVLQDD